MKKEPYSYEKKNTVPCIWLSDSNSEKVAVDVMMYDVMLSCMSSLNLNLTIQKGVDSCVLWSCLLDLSVFEQSDKEDADEELSNSISTPKGRKKIRKIIEDDNLRAETQEALREEEERCKRLADREQHLEDRREVMHT